MPRSTMTLERLKAILESYGTRPGLWPEAEREDAEALLRTAPDAAQMIGEESKIDELLALAAEAAPASESFFKRLFDIPAANRGALSGARNTVGSPSRRIVTETGMGWLRQSGIAVPMTGLALASVLGLMLGFSNFSAAPQSIELIDASAYLFEIPSVAKDMENVD